MSLISHSFHQLYYDSNAYENTQWLGVKTLKCPLDLWVYQPAMASAF